MKKEDEEDTDKKREDEEDTDKKREDENRPGEKTFVVNLFKNHTERRFQIKTHIFLN